jgi:hypothetical protein
MDFGDIFTLLLYIVIPIFISGKRNANKAKKAQQQRRQLMENQPMQRQPMQDKNTGGGLMGRLESMMKEIEKSVETGEPIGGKKTTGAPKPVTKPLIKPMEPVTREETYKAPGDGPYAAGVPGQGESVQPEKIPVWRVAPLANREEAVRGPEKTRHKTVPAREAVPAAAGQGGALFGRDDLVKGIILSEILQPPVALRQRNKRRSF